MNELLISLDSHKETALYEQIYEHIKQDIMGGKLSHGERLPSARMLAENLQVSRSTVDAAYGQLVSEGYLLAKRGSGYYVCDVAGLYDLAPEMLVKTQETARGAYIPDSNSHCLGINWPRPAAKRKMRENGNSPCNYNMLPGQIDSEAFSYGAWRKAGKEAMLEIEHELLLPGHPQGEYGLRRAVAHYLYQARCVCCMPEQLVVGAGNEYLLLLLGQILGHTGVVAMENPTYPQAYHTFRNMGYEMQAIPMDADGMLVQELARKDAALAYVMPSHQFPLGSVMPFKRRLQLLAWAQERQGRYIIEDDHDSEFRYKGKPIPSLQSMDRQGRVIYLGTFSNSIMPSIRVSYMVLPEELLRIYHKTCGFYASTVSRLIQMNVCKFIEDGGFERHLNKMRRIYKGRHDLLLQLLKGRKWVRKIYGAHAGLHLAVELNCPLSEQEVLRRAKARGIMIQGIRECLIVDRKNTLNPVMLLGFGNLPEEKIRAGIETLEKCVQLA